MRPYLHAGAMVVLLVALPVFGAGLAPGTAPGGNTVPAPAGPAAKGPSVVGRAISMTPPTSRGRIGDVRPRAASVSAQAGASVETPYHRRRSGHGVEGPAGGWEAPASWSAATAYTGPRALAPFLSRSIDGLDLADIFTLNPVGTAPPDTMGAAGPDHLVNIVNGGVRIFNKATGAVDNTTSLQGFWGPLGTAPGEPANDTYDPKVLFDPQSGRFVAVSIGGRDAPDSWILLAVSTTSNPNEDWNLYAIDADQDADGIVRANAADFPCLGVDDTHVYVTANMFDNVADFQYVKAWAFRKPELLQGATSLTVTEFRDPPGSGFTSQPAQVFGAAPAEYVASEGWFDTATQTLRFLRIATITFPGGVGTWTDRGFVRVNGYSFSFPEAPQPGGGAPIDADDGRLANLVYRGGLLYTTHTVTPSITDNTRTEVAWYEIDPASTAPSSSTAPPPLQQGRISDPSRFYYYPSIAVNSRKDIVIGFSGSSPTEFAGAYYSYRSASDPPGTAAVPVVLRQGAAPYTVIGSSSGKNRWGDYSATCLDPVSDNTFWTIQEYAKARNTWGTVWGEISFGPPPPPPPSPLGTGGIFGPAGSGSGSGCSIGAAVPGRSRLGMAGCVVVLLAPAIFLFLRRKILAVRSPKVFRR